MHKISAEFPLGEFPSPLALLQWYDAAGVDVAVGDQPLDCYAVSQRAAARRAASPSATTPTPAAPRMAGASAARLATPDMAALPGQAEQHSAAHLAQACESLDALRRAVSDFRGCALRLGAPPAVFADGAEQARLMVVGLAPGPEDSRQGLPFVGPEGHLLRRMLGSIGQDRDNTRLTTLFPWPLTAGMAANPADLAACLPFLERHIELVGPAVLLVVGEGPARALLARREGITRLRGQWHAYETPGLSHPVPLLTTYGMEQARQTPHQKREAWRHMLAVLERLRGGQGAGGDHTGADDPG